MHADTEDEVVTLLRDTGHWDDEASWRYLGDTDNNFGSIGNQQREPVAALIEKIINGVDARLMNECLRRGINPASDTAPKDMRIAVAQFFEGHDGHPPPDAGNISEWQDARATEEGELLTVVATGNSPRSGSGFPSLSISDSGEGQSPADFPDTFMSLGKSNKLRIPFVQGKFNMGGTGALSFCSPKHHLQLIVSRRNPAIIVNGDPRAQEWGFTVVRREPPRHGTRSSVYSYLAPHDSETPRCGQVLSFHRDSLSIFPLVEANRRTPYGRAASHGTLIKLYEYQLDGTKSNIVRSGGNLLQRLDFGMPRLALPIRLYECREGYRGHSGSFATNVLGVVARLDRDRQNVLEPGFPIHTRLDIDGNEIRVRVYALKDSAANYRSGQDAIVFTVNGQTHATKSSTFFRRKSVRLDQLADSLLVVVDCSGVTGTLREDLFMNSRDRLRNKEIGRALEAELERLLHTDESLRKLRTRRRQKLIEQQLDDARPLADALRSLVQNTPELEKILLNGAAISSPFPRIGDEGSDVHQSFQSRRFPTYFKFRGKDDGADLERDVNVDNQARLQFETDAEDDYFDRASEPGAFEATYMTTDGASELPIPVSSLSGPTSGRVTLSFHLPPNIAVDDVILAQFRVTDPSRIDALELSALLTVRPHLENPPRPPRPRPDPPTPSNGERPGSLALPNINVVTREEWPAHGFTDLSALKIDKGDADGQGRLEYDFFVNVDNKYLRTAQKSTQFSPEVLKMQFMYALVLLSLGLLVDDNSSSSPASEPIAEDGAVEEHVAKICARLAPYVLPTLEALGSLED
jgi:hypothetical protein